MDGQIDGPTKYTLAFVRPSGPGLHLFININFPCLYESRTDDTDGRTKGPTDGQTDGPTDGATDRRTHLKTNKTREFADILLLAKVGKDNYGKSIMFDITYVM